MHQKKKMSWKGKAIAAMLHQAKFQHTKNYAKRPNGQKAKNKNQSCNITHFPNLKCIRRKGLVGKEKRLLQCNSSLFYFWPLAKYIWPIYLAVMPNPWCVNIWPKTDRKRQQQQRNR